MAEGSGSNSIGRANLDLGVNAAPLEQGMESAKTEAVAKAVETERAIANATGDDSARYEESLRGMAVKQEEQRRAFAAAEESARSANMRAQKEEFDAYIKGIRDKKETLAETTDSAAASSKKLSDNMRSTNAEAGTAGIRFAQLKVGMFAIVGAAKQLWDGIKGARAAGEDFGKTMRSVEQAFRTDIEENLNALGKRRAEIIRTALAQKEALDNEIRQRDAIQDLVAWATDDVAEKAVRQKIDTETDLAMKRIGMIKKDDLDRLAAVAQEELRQGNARISLARKRAEDEAAVRVEAEIAANKLIEDDKRRRGLETQAELMRMQQAQFAQLRNDINGLFNTSGLEVGINRIGALIETLIQKTGDSR